MSIGAGGRTVEDGSGLGPTVEVDAVVSSRGSSFHHIASWTCRSNFASMTSFAQQGGRPGVDGRVALPAVAGSVLYLLMTSRTFLSHSALDRDVFMRAITSWLVMGRLLGGGLCIEATELYFAQGVGASEGSSAA